jgi:hypothetical protein
MPEDLMQRLAAGKARAHRSIAQTLGDCADGSMIAYHVPEPELDSMPDDACACGGRT